MDHHPKLQALDVWGAAQEIIDTHPEQPESAACQLADEAWEAGDLLKFQRLMQIANAVRELVRTRPHLRKAIN